jgi:hypothetical protein
LSISKLPSRRQTIEVRISHDEFVVVSFPGPDRSIRLEDLQAGRAVSRRYRNRRIGEFFLKGQMAETVDFRPKAGTSVQATASAESNRARRPAP